MEIDRNLGQKLRKTVANLSLAGLALLSSACVVSGEAKPHRDAEGNHYMDYISLADLVTRPCDFRSWGSSFTEGFIKSLGEARISYPQSIAFIDFGTATIINRSFLLREAENTDQPGASLKLTFSLKEGASEKRQGVSFGRYPIEKLAEARGEFVELEGRVEKFGESCQFVPQEMGVRRIVKTDKIYPDEWRFVTGGLGNENLTCDDRRPGNAGQLWVLWGVDGQIKASEFSYDRPEPLCS